MRIAAASGAANRSNEVLNLTTKQRLSTAPPTTNIPSPHSIRLYYGAARSRLTRRKRQLQMKSDDPRIIHVAGGSVSRAALTISVPAWSGRESEFALAFPRPRIGTSVGANGKVGIGSSHMFGRAMRSLPFETDTMLPLRSKRFLSSIMSLSSSRCSPRQCHGAAAKLGKAWTVTTQSVASVT
jgi:hypothetical protein